MLQSIGKGIGGRCSEISEINEISGSSGIRRRYFSERRKIVFRWRMSAWPSLTLHDDADAMPMPALLW